ncbi:endoplasmic oxidoreductin [Auriscalpium vulgare]|uniref:Endoplasmic oxidoreductin n=1 Tax=Auriscalpium vulgare TaxID=40419 RepID=A0ACB8S5S4_9AGAM|nr:endoplasmic oxidoreductin [Auriscalpium vulgare]
MRSALLLPSAILALVLDAAFAADASFLGDALVRKDQVQKVLEHEPARTQTCEQTPTGPIETTMCDYETIESVNDDLYAQLHDLVATPFFKYFRADLYRECPFWDENVLCMNKDCAIATVEEEVIPEKWRSKALSSVERAEHRESLPGCYYRDSDFCFLDDETEGDYVDLSLNPERYTGYIGESAHRVWKAIYEENCFGQSEASLTASHKGNGPVVLPDTMASVLRIDGQEPAEQCLEKRVYYKVISGLHASISTHICHEHLDPTTGKWGPDLQCYVNRIASHPERLQYIYFNTVLLLRAVARLGPYLSAYDYCASGTHEEHTATVEKMNKVIEIADFAGHFDETVLFRGEQADIVKEEFKQHFRNVTRIMDCVGCDKCRLWGKVQTSGVGTALKVLFEMDEKALDPKTNANLLQRTEVVALINTLHRFTESLHAVADFRRLWRAANATDSAKLIQEAEKAVKSQPARPSPVVGAEDMPPANLLQGVQRRLAPLVQACKDGTVECASIVVEVLQRVSAVVASVFKGSGKEQGPGSRTEL